jgi:hypothetical protein
MPSKDRTVAEKTEAEFKKKARSETFADSAVDESLDRMAGASQDIVEDEGKVRDKLRRKAKELNRP